MKARKMEKTKMPVYKFSMFLLLFISILALLASFIIHLSSSFTQTTTFRIIILLIILSLAEGLIIESLEERIYKLEAKNV